MEEVSFINPKAAPLDVISTGEVGCWHEQANSYAAGVAFTRSRLIEFSIVLLPEFFVLMVFDH